MVVSDETPRVAAGLMSSSLVQAPPHSPWTVTTILPRGRNAAIASFYPPRTYGGQLLNAVYDHHATAAITALAVAVTNTICWRTDPCPDPFSPRTPCAAFCAISLQSSSVQQRTVCVRDPSLWIPAPRHPWA